MLHRVFAILCCWLGLSPSDAQDQVYNAGDLENVLTETSWKAHNEFQNYQNIVTFTKKLLEQVHATDQMLQNNNAKCLT